MSDEVYIDIEATLLVRTPKAVLIKTDEAEGWVPRSCVHFITDKEIDEMRLNNVATFKVMQWVAKRNGFI